MGQKETTLDFHFSLFYSGLEPLGWAAEPKTRLENVLVCNYIQPKRIENNVKCTLIERFLGSFIATNEDREWSNKNEEAEVSMIQSYLRQRQLQLFTKFLTPPSNPVPKYGSVPTLNFNSMFKKADCLELSAVGNLDGSASGTTLRSNSFDRLDDIHSFDNRSEDTMLSIKPGCLSGTEEELGSVGVGSSVGHREDSGTSVLQLEVLILELVSVDGLSSSSVVVCEVSALAHESWNDTVEGAALVAKARLAGAKLTEILSCLWNDIATKSMKRYGRGKETWMRA